MVVIIRYVFNGEIFEMFWAFVKPEGYAADILANCLMDQLKLILNSPADNSKLIAQSYDGAAVMSGKNNGVQAINKNIFPHAHFVHCYAHQFNLIMERATQCNRNIKIFFANVQSFSTLFSRSPKRTAVLDQVVKRRLPRAVATKWNFKSRVVNTVFEYNELLKEYLENIIDQPGMDSKTISEASGLLKFLDCPEFMYWLNMFHRLMPHVEIFFNQA